MRAIRSSGLRRPVLQNRTILEALPSMKNFFRNIGAKLQQWMSGRYGFDELSRSISFVILALLLLACVPDLQFLSLLAFVLWFWVMFRSMSRNLTKRREERAAYLRFTGRIKSWFSLKRKAWKERKTHRYFRCKQCKTMLRVPKGKGKIKIVCSKCHNEIVKKT